MLVYLLRHGIAENRAASDAVRELTREGLLQTQAVVEKFKQHAPQLDMAIVSPYVRARQTASCVQSAFPDLQFDVDSRIKPSGDVIAVMDAIEGFGVQQLLLVGHNPLLSNLLTHLVDRLPQVNSYMRNSMLVCVSMDIVASGCGELVFTIEP